MIRILLTLTLLSALTLVTGCAGLTAALGGTDSSEGIGSYSYTVGEDCKVRVESRTLRGGPEVVVTRDRAGTCGVRVQSGSRLAEQLPALLQALGQ
jgi:hypothetical protein